VATLVPESKQDIEEITVENPTQFFVHVFRESLLQSGISVKGKPVDVDLLSVKPEYSDSELRQIAVNTSAPLSDIVAGINKPSQNLYADMVLKTLAAERPVDDEDLKPGSSAMGVEAAMRTFSRAGIDTSRIQLVDGSGLSSMNLVTPEMTTSLMAYMWNHPSLDIREAFYNSLPVAGAEGTLRNRLKTGPARENLRAKTGSLSNASTLSGFLRTENGTPLAFSLMCNHYTIRTSEVRDAQDEVVNLLARYRP
jgi:D-alanyl-D-alanine carboxypeptidase/D-alanyl-D-alanine-endopeptidase (penicillin-binding protein 4)